MLAAFPSNTVASILILMIIYWYLL